MSIIAQNRETVASMVTSMEVAEMIGKDHRHLLADIRRYCSQLAETKIGLGDFFTESTYYDANQQERPCYLITEKGCDFIAHKINGIKGTSFTAKYVNRFHEMKQELASPMQLSTMQQIHLLAEGNIELEQRIEETSKDLQNFKMDIPMFPVELDEVTKAAKKKGVEVIGGKESAAYGDRSLVNKVYRDIYGEIHRQFGVNSYKAIKRKDVDAILKIISEYHLPVVLQNEVDSANCQMVLNIH